MVRLQYSTRASKHHDVPNTRSGLTHDDRPSKTCTICRDERVTRY